MVIFQIHLNHISSLVVLPKMAIERANKRERERKERCPKDVPKRKAVRKEKERKKSKRRKEMNKRTCPQDVIKISLTKILKTIGMTDFKLMVA